MKLWEAKKISIYLQGLYYLNAGNRSMQVCNKKHHLRDYVAPPWPLTSLDLCWSFQSGFSDYTVYPTWLRSGRSNESLELYRASPTSTSVIQRMCRNCTKCPVIRWISLNYPKHDLGPFDTFSTYVTKRLHGERSSYKFEDPTCPVSQYQSPAN